MFKVANADGGDLIVGIDEKNGLASRIDPVAIDNIDRFELELRNVLLPIQPAVPPVDFAFIPAENGYAVVIHIDKGMLKPYITIEDQTVFRFFVRHGNRKEPMTYVDGDRIICAPIEIKDISDSDNVEEMIEECKKMTRYALGRR